MFRRRYKREREENIHSQLFTKLHIFESHANNKESFPMPKLSFQRGTGSGRLWLVSSLQINHKLLGKDSTLNSSPAQGKETEERTKKMRYATENQCLVEAIQHKLHKHVVYIYVCRVHSEAGESKISLAGRTSFLYVGFQEVRRTPHLHVHTEY